MGNILLFGGDVMKKIMQIVYAVTATFFYVGYIPGMPGTYGSLAAIPFIFFLQSPMYFIAVIIVLFLAGRYSARVIAENQGNDDPQCIVIDEVVGMMIALFLIPYTLKMVCLSFIAFRLFDIVKPFGIRKLETIPHGYGIMLDDVAAGICANIVVHVCMFFFS